MERQRDGLLIDFRTGLEIGPWVRSEAATILNRDQSNAAIKSSVLQPQIADFNSPNPFPLSSGSRSDQEILTVPSSTTLAEFVEKRFVPEYVSGKTFAGRAHFQSILKLLLTPELVNRAFGVDPRSRKIRHKPNHSWPYMDHMRLSSVRAENVRGVMKAALDHGYSSQTVIHIRSVLRAVFFYASKQGEYSGPNPAALAKPPCLLRRDAHSLTLEQWSRVVSLMRYPEREIAFLATLTGMSVAEICGLQWKCVNLVDCRGRVDGEWAPARAIAVRNQSYRGEFGPVTENRKRFVSLPEMMCAPLRVLKERGQFTGPNDFVLTARSGTPVSQDNLAARRLKAIGRSTNMPWLSWQVFHRTHLRMSAEFGRRLQTELRRVIDKA